MTEKVRVVGYAVVCTVEVSLIGPVSGSAYLREGQMVIKLVPVKLILAALSQLTFFSTRGFRL